MAKLLVRLVERLHARALVAGDGAEAVRAAVAEPPDLIIADLLLPDMDGLSAVRAIRDKLGADSPPVIVLTGHANPENIRQAVDLNVVDFLTKPTALTDQKAEDRIRALLETPPVSGRRRPPAGKRRRKRTSD